MSCICNICMEGHEDDNIIKTCNDMHIFCEFTYVNGIVEGVYKEWNLNGSLKEESLYVNGIKQ